MYGSQQSWKRTFILDRFGNRTFDTASGKTTTLPASFNANIFNPKIDAANNRYGSEQGYAYDAAGNLTANPLGQSFTYDAEHRQKEVKVTATGAAIATYQYNGLGQRIKRSLAPKKLFLFMTPWANQLRNTNSIRRLLPLSELAIPLKIIWEVRA